MIDTTYPYDVDLDGILLEAALAGGRNTRLVLQQFGVVKTIAIAQEVQIATGTANQWSRKDMKFLYENAGLMGDEELAALLGRSQAAIKIRRTRWGLPSPTKHPDYFTANTAALALGIDVKAVCKLIERGHLSASPAPLSERFAWRLKRTYLYTWATNPDNWAYFYRSIREPERMKDAKLRSLILRRAELWGDEWWTVGEVAAWHGISSSLVNRNIREGRLRAVRWNNWMIRRSDATNPRFRFFPGKGARKVEGLSTSRQDAFVLLAVAAGIPFTQISRMMRGRKTDSHHSYVQGRIFNIAKRGITEYLIAQYNLPILRRADGALWADWRTCGRRFSLVEKAWEKFENGETMTSYERYALGGVLRSAVVWVEGEDSPLAKGLKIGTPGDVLLNMAMDVYRKLAAERAGGGAA